MVRNEGEKLVTEPLTEAALKLHLAQKADWFSRTDKGDQKPAYPPKECVQAMLAFPDPPVPTVHRITAVPLMARDATLIQTRGLHRPDGSGTNQTAP